MEIENEISKINSSSIHSKTPNLPSRTQHSITCLIFDHHLTRAVRIKYLIGRKRQRIRQLKPMLQEKPALYLIQKFLLIISNKTDLVLLLRIVRHCGRKSDQPHIGDSKPSNATSNWIRWNVSNSTLHADLGIPTVKATICIRVNP